MSVLEAPGPPGETVDPGPDIRAYLVAGFVSLLFLLLLLAANGHSLAGLLVSCLGSAGLLLRWRSAPAFLMLTLVGLLLLLPTAEGLLLNRGWIVTDAFEVGERLVFCTVVLTYLMAQYRLFVLSAPGEPVAMGEMPEASQLLWRVPLCAIGAALLWWLLPANSAEARRWLGLTWPLPAELRELRRALDFRPAGWRLLALVWLLGTTVLGTAGVLAALAFRRMSAAEAEMYLQDLGWSETRREQQRIHRWRAWFRRQSSQGGR